MFREMRRNRQALSAGNASALLEAGTSGVLAVAGDDGYPYAVPLSYACDREGERIWFHCARSGHKLDAVRRCEKASFCVIVQDQIVPEEYTTHFRSVIAFGRVRELTDEAERRTAALALARKYHPGDSEEHRQSYLDRSWASLCLLELRVEHLTGKQARELAEASS